MSGMTGLIARGIVSAACLVPPTLLMGASFPAIARSVEGTPKPIPWLGAFYSANIAGAIVGCVIAGFYLLRVYDMATATYAAAAINAAVALGALASAAVVRRREAHAEGYKPVYVRRAPGVVAMRGPEAQRVLLLDEAPRGAASFELQTFWAPSERNFGQSISSLVMS